MPCRDYYDDHPDQYFKDVTEPALKARIAFAESALCQSLAAIEGMHQVLISVGVVSSRLHPFDGIDFDAAGITKESLIEWWKNHKERDASIVEANRIAKLKKSALQKLTADERTALGLK